jgi:GT2 family glycosyltransferase
MSAATGQPKHGYIDIYGFSPAAAGWIFAGWIGRDWPGGDEPIAATLEFSGGQIQATAHVCLFERNDIKKLGTGMVILADSLDASHTYLTDVILHAGDRAFRIVAAQMARSVEENQLLDRCRDMISAAPRTGTRADFLRRFSRAKYTGQDTLATLKLPVMLELDALYYCPPHGLLMRGWFIDPFHTILRIRLQSQGATHIIDPAQWVRIPRPDVAQSLSERHGTIEQDCGFLVYVSPLPDPAGDMYFEIETTTGGFVFKRVAAPIKTGLAAMREILGVFDLRQHALVHGYDVVVGPAIAAMNTQRLKAAPRVQVTQYGMPPAAPRCSIIVPLYGRMDFLEYQLGFFARTLAPDHELLYVLDDPGRQRELSALAAACFAKFGVAFTVLALSHNMGYGPANNIGLRHARAPFVCFLNSDVFPDTPDWLEHMLASAAAPDVGAVGALLLFEDGTIQHEGIAYEALPEFGGWIFGLHPNKGRFPAREPVLQDVDGVTGACLLMPTALARDLGGFDEGFVIGDFEDADLCKQVQARGLRCVLDRRARLYHLERQSQGDQQQIWRTNLTLFNAWRFQRKWQAADALDRGAC